MLYRHAQTRFWPRSRIAAGLFSIALGACVADTVDLGDNPETPNVNIDEDFFHCRIQPEVITQFSCAAGGSGDQGGCHAARSALRLVEVPTKPRCQGDQVIGAPPSESEVNLERVRIEIGLDVESSPLYRRPVGLDSHPRVIFEEDSEAADLLRTWLTRSAP